jgi:hypothetical protein
MKKIIALSFLIAFAATLQAQVSYTSRVTYNLAHPLNYIIDFNNYTPAPTQYNGVTAATPFGNVSFAAIPSTDNIEFLGSSAFPFLGANNLTLFAFKGQFNADSLLITLPANSFSFGLDVISPSTLINEPYQFTIFSGSTVLATGASPSANNSYTFFGFDSLTTPITSVAIQIIGGVGSGTPVIDNFTIVPEPGTSFAAALALSVIGFSQRKRLRGMLKDRNARVSPL